MTDLARTPVVSPLIAPLRMRVDGGDVTADPSRLLRVALTPTPRLAWSLPDDIHEAPPTRVAVRTPSGALHDEILLPAGARTAAGIRTPLAPFSTYEWSLAFATREDPAGTAVLETAAFTEDDWTAPWLAVPAGATIPCDIGSVTGVQRAWLLLTAQGLVRADIDGHVVNESHLDPSRTDVVRALYRCYDVTDLIDGARALNITVGHGEWARTGAVPRVRAELVVRHDDGTLSRVHPDENSRLVSSEITVDEPFYRERHEPLAAGAALDVHPDPLRAPGLALPGTITPDPGPPITRIATLPLRTVSRARGVRVFDVGTNIAGRARVTLSRPLPRGQKIRVAHGEHLDRFERLDTSNLSMPDDRDRPRQVLEWISDGASTVIEPWFAYYGFRYVEATGIPDDAELAAEADVVHSDVRPSGRVDTDATIIATLLARTERTFLNNLHGVPEDCPTREQAAWTGDAASVSEYALAAFHSERFLRKWVEDLVTSVLPSGELPSVAPDVRPDRFRGDPVWGSALHRTLAGHWMHYGDADLVRHALPGLRRWADFQWSCRDEAGIVAHAPVSHGQDWLALEQTPAELLHTAAAIDCLVTLARLETDLGEVSEAARRTAQADALRGAARRAFVDRERGVVGSGSQGAYATAIEAGILNADEAQGARQRIVRDIRDRGWRVSGGFGTVRSIVRALSDGGAHDVLLAVLRQPEEPGVGAMLASGPGTLWESWWIDPTNAGTGSLDHVGLGGPFASWMWEGLVGLRPTRPGYGRFDLAPHLTRGVGRLDVTTELPQGELRVSIEHVSGRLTVKATVPAGTEGRLILPGFSPVPLPPGEHRHSVPMATLGEELPRAVDDVPWQAPPLAPAPADVDADPLILDAGSLTPGRGDPSIVERPPLACTPVPHAQLARNVFRVTAREPGVAPTVLLRTDDGFDVHGARFLYASIDLCVARLDVACELVLVVRAADGSSRTGTARAWPASWNRVAVDLDDWAGASQIRQIEVGIRHLGDERPSLPLHPPAADGRDAFHLGDIGVSSRRRTW